MPRVPPVRSALAVDTSFPLARLGQLISAAVEVVEQADLHEVLVAAVSASRDLTGARYAALGVIGEHQTLSDFVYVGVEDQTARAIGHLPIGKGLLGTIIKTGQTIRVDHISDHPDSVGFPGGHPSMDGFLGVPIRIKANVFGNFYLTDKPDGFNEQDAMLIETLAALVAGAVDSTRRHERLRKLSLVEERERIARDLHDEVIQTLFAVGLSLQGIALRSEDSDLRRGLEQAVARLDESIQDLRTFIFDLRRLPGDLADELEELVEKLLPQDKHIEATVTVSRHLPRLNETLNGHVRLIVKEAVSNAVRHASPAHVTVTLDRDGDYLTVAVVDDGSGFNRALVEGGMGLANVGERVAQAGGIWRIESELGSGTNLLVDIPL